MELKVYLKFAVDTFFTVCGCEWDNGGERDACNWFKARKLRCYKRQRKRRNWVGFFDTYDRRNGFWKRLYYRIQYTIEELRK